MAFQMTTSFFSTNGIGVGTIHKDMAMTTVTDMFHLIIPILKF